MNMKKVWLCLFFLGSTSALWSQELPKKKFHFDHVVVTTGGELGTEPLLMSRQDFTKLAPGATLYPAAMREDIRMGMMVSWNASIFNIQLGWTPMVAGSSEKSKHRNWRVGLMAQGFQSSLYSNVNENTFRVDTLYQGSTGSIYGFLDSTERYMSNGYYRATSIKADIAHIWSTDNTKRFNLFAGLGMNAGLNIAPKTEIFSNRWSESVLRDANGEVIRSNGSYNSNWDFERETFQNKTGFASTAYIPMGLDFRVGNKREYLKNLHLFSEIRPALNVVVVPETRTYIFPTIQSTIGVKWCW